MACTIGDNPGEGKTMTAADAKAVLKGIASPDQAAAAMRFFKTAPGEYGEGDVFIGVTVPQVRKVARGCRGMDPGEIEVLLQSPIHEERLLALIVMVEAAKKEPTAIHTLYLRNIRFVNNWDLVDTSAPALVGAYLFDKPRRLLATLAKSANLWERRIAIIATLSFIRHNQFDDTLKIAGMLLKDRHDLIHKATGWMLREVGNRDETVLQAFLAEHAARMPRTMLRYAIEKFPPDERRAYLARKE
jgi:3-methyladenine DNA glycosylase AlkD